MVVVNAVPPSEETDGRRLRRENNREAVLDAMIELFTEGVYEPRAHQIAQRAGLSPRSLFRYFDDVDDLNRAAIERLLADARPLVELPVGPDHPTEAKIHAVIASRVALYEAVAPAARAARVTFHRLGVVREQVSGTRVFLRRQLRGLFQPELDRGAASLFPAIDALCSFETYELIRHDQRLSREATTTVLAAALRSLLLPAPPRSFETRRPLP